MAFRVAVQNIARAVAPKVCSNSSNSWNGVKEEWWWWRLIERKEGSVGCGCDDRWSSVCRPRRKRGRDTTWLWSSLQCSSLEDDDYWHDVVWSIWGCIVGCGGGKEWRRESSIHTSGAYASALSEKIANFMVSEDSPVEDRKISCF